MGLFWCNDGTPPDVYRDGKQVELDAGGKVQLEKGDNLLGFLIEKMVGNES